MTRDPLAKDGCEDPERQGPVRGPVDQRLSDNEELNGREVHVMQSLRVARLELTGLFRSCCRRNRTVCRCRWPDLLEEIGVIRGN